VKQEPANDMSASRIVVPHRKMFSSRETRRRQTAAENPRNAQVAGRKVYKPVHERNDALRQRRRGTNVRIVTVKRLTAA